jgi:S1-C subfamily serine protease
MKAAIKVALVFAIAGGAMYWLYSRQTAPAAAPGAKAPASAPVAAATPAVSPAAAAAPPAPDAQPDAPGPSALERVMAAAEASKKRDAAAAAADAVPAAPEELETLISHAMPAVVRVETATGFGTGFFVTTDTLLTNVHVVGANTSVVIRRQNGATVAGRVDMTAPEFDVAVVRIANPDAHQATLPMGSGGRARPGQEVVALGTPLGLQNTVTRGIVSAVRQVRGLTLVQTDAAINPGNSGGPLIDRTGHVIGITTMGLRAAQGLSFAVGIEHAEALLAGKRSPELRGTPISSLNEAMNGGAAPGKDDTARQGGAAAYDQIVAAIARRADALDDRWRSFRRTGCYQGNVGGGFTHEWFAFWDARAMQGNVAAGCEASFADIRRAADIVRDNVLAAGEAARQADVYPGTRREILHRYRLDYPGWDR